MMSYASKEREDRMSRLMFNRENLSQLRGAVNKLLDIFHAILEKDFQYGSYFKHDEILARFEEVEQEDWDDIRKRYINDDFHGYCNKKFSDDELCNPAKILLDFLSMLDALREGISEKIEQKHQAVLEYEKKFNEFRDQSDKIHNQLMREKEKMMFRVCEAAGLEGKVQQLEKTLEEKMNKVAELQRASSVQLWEKEKERVLKDANTRIEELEKEVKQLKQNSKNLTRRMSTMDDQCKMIKLKKEMSGDRGENGEDMQVLKRESYMKEKDITHLEGELFSQQKLYLGILGGIRTDVNKLSERFYDEETATRDSDFVKLSRTIDRVYNATAEGQLKTMKGTLPPHYFHYDTDVQVKRVRRLSKVAVLPYVLPQIGHKFPSKDQDKTDSPSKNGEVHNPYTYRKRPGTADLPPVSENPVIVDPVTNKMNGTTYLKHFPHMAQPFILGHWDKFKEYDKNGDRSLDLTEVVKALTSLGCDFTTDQVAEAMDEVDLDHSQTLDFYEYLLIVEKVVKKSVWKVIAFIQGQVMSQIEKLTAFLILSKESDTTGKSELFSKGLARQNNTEVSKACVVQ